MFLPFGQTSEEVLAYMDARDYAQYVEYIADSGHMQLDVRGQEVLYVFDEDILYAVEDQRQFYDKDLADHVVETCLDFMALEERRVRNLDSPSGQSHYATVADDRIIELVVIDQGTRKAPDIRVRLKVTSRLYGPRMQTEAFAAQVARRGL
ncbi:MAG: hypothetical protein D6722_04425 [Bacteroidetes bacterium]|nr:MAG: hypothetical protein D6722_04425 [Bacteroidota bacterium]